MLSALAVPVERWNGILKEWLSFRKQLYTQHEVPTDYELHSQHWLSRTPEPLSPDPDTGYSRDIRILRAKDKEARRDRFRLYESALKVIGNMDGLQIFTVAVDSREKFELYQELIRRIDGWLVNEKARGLVVLDGLDQGHHYRKSHRRLKLKSRHLLEDPMECSSEGSQLIQMADVVVHASFRYLRGKESDHPAFLRVCRDGVKERMVIPDAEFENPDDGDRIQRFSPFSLEN